MKTRPSTRSTTLLAATATALLALGCNQPPDMSPAYGYDDPYPAAVNDPQITVVNADLRPWLGFHREIVVDDGQRPMSVEVPVRNLSDSYKLIDYRVLFYDGAGRELEPAMGWRLAPMEAKQTVRLKGQALDTEAVDWKLEVKWAR